MDFEAEDYEKSFIEKYLERTSKSKIDEVLQKIAHYRGIGRMEKVNELELEIEKIQKELVADKAIILEESFEEKNFEGKEAIDFRWDVSTDDTEAEGFESKCQKARSIYCAYNGVLESEFEGDLRKNSEVHNGFSIPGFLWNCLFPYQQDGVRWLLGLYRAGKGGVLADDMGLGKTIQIIGFLVALIYNNHIEKALVLCPATVIPQWLSEWKKFYPFVRIFYKMGAVKLEGVYLVSYERFKLSAKDYRWDVLVLDEGHRIKNKDAQITLAVKKLRAEYKFVLSGTPIQNNLGELWSIFDFVNPGLLGSHTCFSEEFEDIISQGGYRNANSSQVEKSYKHSLILRSLIEPYMLRRTKSQVSHKLPSKIDKIIFCPLSSAQTQHYNRVLESKHIMDVLTGKANLLSGISILRKICNHPRLLLPKNLRYRNTSMVSSGSAGFKDKRFKKQSSSCVLNDSLEALGHGRWESKTFGSNSKEEESIGFENCFELESGLYDLIGSSCKIEILLSLLGKWNAEGSKVLIFSQTIEMLNIIEDCIVNYSYLRMDGTTPTSLRPCLVKRFNSDESIFIFLLTTRVGGLGLNLVGASRIVIYDPDWNPSTDTQAKERAWRYGQKRDVEIYRFICKDTIEEKIYQKQIFKDLLGKKVLNNPRLSRFFNKSCINELFNFTFTSSATEIKVHEAHQDFKEETSLIEVKSEDQNSFSRMKFLNEKRILKGEELLEYIRLRENSVPE